MVNIKKKSCKCNDIIFHAIDVFRIEEKLKELKPVKGELDLPIPERIGKIYAYPDIESYKRGYIKGNGVLAICVDNTKVKVSDDLDAFHKDEKEWRRKLVTLKEFRELPKEKRKGYTSPEAIIDPKDACEDNIFGAMLYGSGQVIPLKIGEIELKKNR